MRNTILSLRRLKTASVFCALSRFHPCVLSGFIPVTTSFYLSALHNNSRHKPFIFSKKCAQIAIKYLQNPFICIKYYGNILSENKKGAVYYPHIKQTFHEKPNKNQQK